MDLQYDDMRPSDNLFIDHVWRSHSETAGSFISMADIHSSIVISRFSGKTWVTFRGPEAYWTPAFAPSEAEWLGIVLSPGAYLSSLPPARIMDRQDFTVEGSRLRGFSFGGFCLEIPNFSNAEGIVERLDRSGLLHYDPLVAEVLRKQTPSMSVRNIQRRFHHATGLVPIRAFQIERARLAARQLKDGRPIIDVAFSCGYFDQSHMTRSFKKFIGISPSLVSSLDRAQILSFLQESKE
jgi:hypothetical protein